MFDGRLSELHLKICMIYRDDLIILSNSYEQHLERMRLVFNKLRENGLKLSPKKCKLFKHEVTYVGHIVSADEKSQILIQLTR